MHCFVIYYFSNREQIPAGQEHIITDSSFKNCGYRSDQYNQYDQSETRGCGDSKLYGCGSGSSVFGFLTHSDQFNPEIMQATNNIQFIDVGRRFKFSRTDYQSVSGRIQNWLDVDGSVSGLGEQTLIGSGFDSVGSWWQVDDNVVMDTQAPLAFIRQGDGPARGLAHVRLEWDGDYGEVGSTICGNGRTFNSTSGQFEPLCETVGYIRHLGSCS